MTFRDGIHFVELDERLAFIIKVLVERKEVSYIVKW